MAYHVANEGRKLIECDRLCVGVRHARKKVTVEAVSECADGSVYSLLTGQPAAAPIVNKKRFTAIFLPSPNADLQISITVKGKLKGKKGKGKVKTSGANENGSACSSSARFKAKR